MSGEGVFFCVKFWAVGGVSDSDTVTKQHSLWHSTRSCDSSAEQCCHRTGVGCSPKLRLADEWCTRSASDLDVVLLSKTLRMSQLGC